jgi:HK97 gp10 family phage protein
MTTISVDFDSSQVHALAADFFASEGRIRPKVTDAVQDAGEGIERDAQRMAPRLTGLLSSSVRDTGGGLSVTVSTSVRYAVYQEYGTSKMAPQPFMGPALEANTPSFYAAVTAAAGDIL